MIARDFQVPEDRIWDVAIIGAGVAGAACAILCAQQGFSTLLLEAKAFPREKVCGGCLNQRAQQSLARLGVMDPLAQSGAVWIDRFQIRLDALKTNWSIPRLLSVRRSTLDKLMVEAAVQAGACFYEQTKANVVEEQLVALQDSLFRQIVAKHDGHESVCRAKVVIVADGLTRSSLSPAIDWRSQVESDSRIGVQKLADATLLPSAQLSSTLVMQVHQHGYVGISRTDGQRLNFAGAIAPDSLRLGSSIDESVRAILGASELADVVTQDASRWLATPAMTRHSRRVASERLFLLGDSIGYVEPFTGEGMSWALASAESVMPLVKETIQSGWSERLATSWTSWVAGQRSSRQATCRWIARQLRKPIRAAWVVRICDLCPPVRNAFLRKVCT